MVWTVETSQGREADKIAAFVVPYTRGRGLDIGCGLSKVWPHAIGIDSLKDYGGQKPASVDIVADSSDLSMFADGSLDFVFSSHNLEHIVDYKAALKEWWRLLKVGGHLCLYLPHKEYYPNIGKPGANPDHKHDFLPQDIIDAMQFASWELVENEERNLNDEYSFFQVYRKLKGTKHIINSWQRNPEGKKRILVIRYGAIGDQIVAASILPGLKKQGYHITYNTSPEAQQILLHDPHIDEWLIQDKDQVPNLQLGPYWETIKTRYDKVVNLCESVEGSLLALPGRIQHQYSLETRQKILNVNYLERTHDIANVPYEFNARFYPTEQEKQWALKQLPDAPVVLWAINGSSSHKVYPFAQVVISWLLKKTPAHIFLTGDSTQGLELQNGIIETLKADGCDLGRLHGMAGQWDIRQAISFAQAAHCVVGPETGVLNSVGLDDVKKVIYLSHSSQENLTKHWKNTTVLEPENTSCFPCHVLHYTWDTCHKVEETQAALCASNVKPERVFRAIVDSLINIAARAA